MDPVTGTVVYDESRTARVSSPIAGRVTGSIAALGVRVKQAQTLAEVDSPDLGQAQSDYANAQADLSLATRAFQRTQELYSRGIVPRKDQEQAQDVVTRARTEADRARLKLANFGVRNGGTNNHFALHSPIAGVITERSINPGMEIRPDFTTPLFVISDLSKLWVQMNVFEKDIGLIHVGAKVLVRVPAFPDEKFVATVSYIGQVLDDATRTIKVRCVLPNEDLRLLPFMYASLEIQSASNDKAIVVPLTALFTEDESDWLFVAIGDGHYQKRAVKVGLRLKNNAVITSGLNAGDRLVIDGALLLRTEEYVEEDAEQNEGAGKP
jgi:cobalt-zinc-cadmium efflux system membrane fusion protein